MFKFLRSEVAGDDKSSKVYAHMNPRADKKGQHLWKIGVTNRKPIERRNEYLRAHPSMEWLRTIVTFWKPINSDGCKLDRKRFDDRLKNNLKAYRLDKRKYSTNPTEMYRGKPKEILQAINRTLREHNNTSNR